MMKKLKIISDGSVQGTRLYDSDGNEIGPVEKIEWSIDASDWGGGASATITFSGVAIEASVTPDVSKSNHLLTAPGGNAVVIESIREAERNQEL